MICPSLIISETSDFSYVFDKSDYLMGIAKFIVVPDVEDDLFTIRRYHRSCAIVDSRSRSAHDIC